MRTFKDPCQCGSSNWSWWRLTFTIKEERIERCSECAVESMPALAPDVYFDGSKGANQTDPNLCNREGQPIPFSSKREKAAILKQNGLQEAGDKVKGARNFDKTASKQWDS